MNTDRILALKESDIFPDTKLLQEVLGEAYTTYEAVLQLFADKSMLAEWRYYQDGKAWLCKVQLKKRTIVWMSAWHGSLQATIYIPAKHLDQLASLPLGESRKQQLDAWPFVGKSKACTFVFEGSDDLAHFATLIDFKISCK